MAKIWWWEFEAWNWIYNKSNESLDENKIKNEIEKLLSKCKNEKTIHEHGKQSNK